MNERTAKLLSELDYAHVTHRIARAKEETLYGEAAKEIRRLVELLEKRDEGIR